ncbi:MAG TPA: GYF domain-containing protein [Polyangiaceae bacterium]|nr:GYF domain-containing protein [Polyangiaceae bacterium]
MKFLCENCKAKYQIADEKVAGRSVRMKCRKCQHLIEIRSSVTETSATLVFSANLLRAGASDAPPSVAAPGLHGVSESPTRASAAPPVGGQPVPSVPRPAPRETKQSSRGPEAMVPTGTVVQGGLASAFQQAVAAEAKAVSEPAPSVGGEWFVGINGSPVGPIGADELRARASSGAVQEDSLVWREGFSEWVPLGTVPELRDIARLVRAERSPLSSRAGALISKLNIGPRSVRPPSTSGGQVVPLSSRGDAGKAGGNVPAGQVHETLALSPGAMPLVLPGLGGLNTPGNNTGALGRSPTGPAPAAPAPSAPPPSPPEPAMGSPFGAPGMGGPGMGGPGMGGPGMGGPGMAGPGMGAPMGGPGMGAPMGAPMGGPGMGGPGMGGPAFGMGAPMQAPAPVQQQVMPFQQPFGMGAPAAPPGFGLPPPPGFPGSMTPGFGPVVSTPTPRRKGGIPLAGWFAVAAALGTGVAVGAMVFRSGGDENSQMTTDVKPEGEAGSGDSANGSGESAGSATAEANGSAGSGDSAAEAAGAGGAGGEAGAEAAGSAGEAGSGSTESAGAGGASDSAAGSGNSDSAAGAGTAVAAATNATPTTASRHVGGRHPKGHAAKPSGGGEAAAPVQVPTLTGTPSGPTVSGPTARPSGGGGGGQLTSEQVQGVVNNGRAAIRRACWEPALAAKGGGASSTRVTVNIAIGPDGKVQQASASGGDNFPSLGGCIAGRVRSWIFPSSGGTTQTTATFNFAAQ